MCQVYIYYTSEESFWREAKKKKKKALRLTFSHYFRQQMEYKLGGFWDFFCIRTAEHLLKSKSPFVLRHSSGARSQVSRVTPVTYAVTCWGMHAYFPLFGILFESLLSPLLLSPSFAWVSCKSLQHASVSRTFLFWPFGLSGGRQICLSVIKAALSALTGKLMRLRASKLRKHSSGQV